jgi:hypothetical protein
LLGIVKKAGIKAFFSTPPYAAIPSFRTLLWKAVKTKNRATFSRQPGYLKFLSGNPAIRRWRTRGFPSPDYSGFGFFTSKF